jgi:hypothetical protein
MLRSAGLIFLGVFVGVSASWFAGPGFPAAAATPLQRESNVPQQAQANSANALKYPLHATLYRFRLDTANMPVYREWVHWHHDAYRPMIETLEREKMYFESVFRDTVNEPRFIYWLAIDGEGGGTSSTSTSDIDRKHVEYMKQILVKGSRVTLKTEFTLVPSFIEESIGRHQQAEK